MLCRVVLLFLHFLILLPNSTEQCTERFMELPLVTYRAQRIGINLPEYYVDSNTLRVLQEYQFNCSSTNITSLVLGINIRRVTDTRNLYPSVQVFRPNGSLVTGSERTIYYSTSNVSTSGVFEYPLNPPIPVMSGDLLAVSQPDQGKSVVRVYYISGITANSQEFNYGNTSFDLDESPITDELILVYPVTDGYCVNSTNSINASFIKEKALEVQRSGRFHNQSQFIYPWIVFSCNGSVTKWIFGANNKGNTTIQSELQIWRQLGPNNYNKIGSSLVNANTMIGTNLYELIPQTPLQFQEGDIFGVYNDRNDGERLVLYEQKLNGPINLRIEDNLDSPPSNISEMLITVINDYPLVTPEISISTVAIASSTTENIIFLASLSSHVLSSSSSFSHKLSTTLLITPTTQPTEPSATFLVGGIIVGVVCIILVCTCLLIVACIIVCVRKRSSKSSGQYTNVTVQDNPAYAPTAGFTIGSPTLQDDPAYASISNTVPVDDDTVYMYARKNSSSLYSTIMNPNQVDDDDDDDYI